jgi:hypothetical protein
VCPIKLFNKFEIHCAQPESRLAFCHKIETFDIS